MKIETLRNGDNVVLKPLTMADFDRSLSFFRALSADERRYLRFDVTNPDVVRRLISEAEAGHAFRVIATVNDAVVGHGALEFSLLGWHRHVAEIRVVVAASHRRQRLGALIVRALYEAAQEHGLERVVMKMADQQTAARKIADRLGFTVDAVLPDHIKDADGNLTALVVMSCSLDAVSRALREFYKSDDWPDG